MGTWNLPWRETHRIFLSFLVLGERMLKKDAPQPIEITYFNFYFGGRI